MGNDTGWSNEQPVHQVTVTAFEMSRTEVTVTQYQACVDSCSCTSPGTTLYCNWDESGRDDHPINCVDWEQASSFCQWVGGRLPSEAEWEYAARGGGQDIEYPWGDQTATCQYAVMYEWRVGCGEIRTWPVCSKTAGNTSHGLCDMAGNVWEWVQDWYHNSYSGAPSDGSAWEVPSGTQRVLRGGSWHDEADSLRTRKRRSYPPTSFRDEDHGFRCAR